MMKLFLSFSIGLILVISAALLYRIYESPTTRTSLIIQLAQELGQKYDMHLSSYGGKFDDGIILISISFKKYGSGPSIEQARCLIISSLNEAIYLVNGNEAMQPFLKTHPFTKENFDLDIAHYDESGREIKPPYILDVSSWAGIIIYRMLSDSLRLETIKEETYDEAVAILNQNTPKTETP